MTALLEPGGRVQQPVRLRARRAPSERVLTEQRLLHRIGARVRDDSLLLSRSKGLRGGGSAQGTTLRPSSLCSFRPRPAVAVVPVADAVANVREHGLKPIFRRLIPALSHAVRQRLETGHASLGLIGFGFVVAIEGVAKGARSDDERSSRGSDGRADPRVTQDPREGRCAGGNPSERRHGREGEVSLAIPIRALEPHLDGLVEVLSGGSGRLPDASQKRRLDQRLRTISVEGTAVLGSTSITLGELQSMAVGDVLDLDQEQPSFTVGGGAAWPMHVGNRGDRRIVRLGSST